MTYLDSNQPGYEVSKYCMDTRTEYLSVVDTVSCEDMEEVLLLVAVPCTEHQVVTEGSVHIQVYLADIRAVLSANYPSNISLLCILYSYYLLHLLVLSFPNFLDSLNIQQNIPHRPSHSLRNSLYVCFCDNFSTTLFLCILKHNKNKQPYKTKTI